MCPHFKISYKATIIKTAWYWHKDRHTDQWNKEPRNKFIHIQSTTGIQEENSRIPNGGKIVYSNKWH